MTPVSNGGIVPRVRREQERGPSWVRCSNCRRKRLWRDIFWHADDGAFYCANVLACEHRLYVQEMRRA